MAPSPSGNRVALRLCSSEALAERGRAFSWTVLWRQQPTRAFALRVDGRVVAYLNQCVHVAAEMDWNPDEFLDAERRFIVCSLHGASYEPSSGRCTGGPCGRGGLRSVQVDERDGAVHWYPSQDFLPMDG
jgi:nitrite reductase/ring-hydroxylating ferredoxin subunit